MAIWYRDKQVGVSDGFKWESLIAILQDNRYELQDCSSDDSVETMTIYGWSLASPAVLTKWSD